MQQQQQQQQQHKISMRRRASDTLPSSQNRQIASNTTTTTASAIETDEFRRRMSAAEAINRRRSSGPGFVAHLQGRRVSQCRLIVVVVVLLLGTVQLRARSQWNDILPVRCIARCAAESPATSPPQDRSPLSKARSPPHSPRSARRVSSSFPTAASSISAASTPEAARKAAKKPAFCQRRDVDLPLVDVASASVKRASYGAASDESEEALSSRKSSMSSGRKRSIFNSSSASGGSRGQGQGQDRQFAVTLFVNESDKTRLVDMLHRAKAVISKKVEKVIGRRPNAAAVAAGTGGKASAQALTSILDDWVSREEEEDRREAGELERMMEGQREQAERMRSRGMEPPIDVRDLVVPTVVSPVPEEDEEELDDDEDEDVTVQEVVSGQENVLQPPKRMLLQPPPSATATPLSPLSPPVTSPSSPRPDFGDVFLPSLDSNKVEHPPSSVAPPDSSSPPPALSAAAALSLSQIQRPESMTVPVGGVWRPEDDEEEVPLFGCEDDDLDRGDDDDDEEDDGAIFGFAGKCSDCDHFALVMMTH